MPLEKKEQAAPARGGKGQEAGRALVYGPDVRAGAGTDVLLHQFSGRVLAVHRASRVAAEHGWSECERVGVICGEHAAARSGRSAAGAAGDPERQRQRVCVSGVSAGIERAWMIAPAHSTILPRREW